MSKNQHKDPAGDPANDASEAEDADPGATGATGIENEKLPDPPGGAEAVAEAGELSPENADEATALRAEVSALKDQLLRSLADMENSQKRHAKDREDAVKYAASKFARDMLDVADNLRRAIESAPEGAARDELPEPVRNLIEGIEATERTLLQALERNGIQRIEALGQKFNPNLHEAMFELEDPTQPAGTVVQVLAPGFTIADRLLRPAQVGVSRGGQPGQPRVDTTA